ncbi:UDP-glucose 4-epimerase GalE [Cloacibacillus porcorum]|uniref:UDP-glucose 4-epimerase GalE n=1 Tax=Cloacibacillus porcorum TaxID=1197717 RepID=UPI001459588C|nr:UDP-glucose 4-epimerase GalE [Cloacibacillus porcorum]MDY5389285.1 UDP-glucose 4-epimerase GalE [Cloacibacillus porcorum]NMF17240.1 UDP-glucose 4-epimerase GalE [Cloacibacillus porcorum]
MNNILVTGGAGFIGSHTSVALLEAGYSVVIADDFSNSKPQTLEHIKEITGRGFVFCEADVTDRATVTRIFDENKIDGVIHFAGYKAVGESVKKPLAYYYNNLVSTIELAKACVLHGVKNFVFSSSATVYGDNKAPFVETMPLMPATNPYGETKVISEKILSDTAAANPGFSVALLRYFNPVGAHESGLIGEAPNGIPNNLMPYITKVAKGELKELRVFGDDYDTVDGTGVRDYIHVMDLAEGHVAALKKMSGGVSVYNLGTGRGTSVLELVTAFERVNGIKIPYKITPRRAGDIATCYAETKKAEQELGWKARRSVEDMCRDSWRFEAGIKI